MYRAMFRGMFVDLSARNSSQKCQITFNFGMAFINDTEMNDVTFFSQNQRVLKLKTSSSWKSTSESGSVTTTDERVLEATNGPNQTRVSREVILGLLGTLVNTKEWLIS
jgi:hypothetical protein